MICKSKYYNQFTEEEIRIGYNSMLKELEVLPEGHPVRQLFAETWFDFVMGKFSYDGATFVKERFSNTIFEVGAFGHDRRNSFGYVGRIIDREFLSIMIVLNYKPELIKERIFFMLLTPLNIARHRFLSTYKKGVPSNLYQL
jgi:hypothetical protein